MSAIGAGGPLTTLPGWDSDDHAAALAAFVLSADQFDPAMAEVARKLGDSDRRIDSLEKAYNLDPSDLDVVSPLLDATIAAGEFDRAEPMLDRLRTAEPEAEIVEAGPTALRVRGAGDPRQLPGFETGELLVQELGSQRAAVERFWPGSERTAGKR